MRYVSIDIETTGLDHLSCKMIEFGAVVEDTNNSLPLNELPKFHCYIIHDNYSGDPYALSMNKEILRRITDRTEGYNYYTPQEAREAFLEFLCEIGLANKFKKNYITVAGKNFFAFDYKFLVNEGWLNNNYFDFYRRHIDPAILYFDPKNDEVLPDLKLCLQRANINKEVSHTSIEDAIDIIKLVRNYYSNMYK